MDRLLGGYLILTAVALAFPHRPDGWAALLAAHGVLALFLLAGGPARLRASSRGRVAEGLLDWYPLLLVPFLYWELPHLSGALWDQHYFDGIVQNWEQSVFGHQPSMTLAARWDRLLLSELLHAFYLVYYPVIYALPAILYLQGRTAAFLDSVFTVMLGFTLAYAVFIVFPVQGPRYLFPAPAGAPSGGMLYGLTHAVLEAGSSRGAAFPSSHVSIAAVQAINGYRHLPRSTPVFVLVTIGICFGAVYGGFHYGVDMIAGVGVGLVAGGSGPYVRRALRRVARSEGGSGERGEVGSGPG